MSKERTFRAYTCRSCLQKHRWDVMLLPEVGRGQCYFCGEVTRELWETPLLIITPTEKKRKSKVTKVKNVDFL